MPCSRGRCSSSASRVGLLGRANRDSDRRSRWSGSAGSNCPRRTGVLVARVVVRNTRADPISLDADQCGRVADVVLARTTFEPEGAAHRRVGRRGQDAHPRRPAIPPGPERFAPRTVSGGSGVPDANARTSPCRWQPAHRSKNAGSCGSTRRMAWRRSGPRTLSSAPKPLRRSRPTGSPSSTSCRRGRPRSNGPAAVPASNFPRPPSSTRAAYTPGSRSESRPGLRPDRRERRASRIHRGPATGLMARRRSARRRAGPGPAVPGGDDEFRAARRRRRPAAMGATLVT